MFLFMSKNILIKQWYFNTDYTISTDVKEKYPITAAPAPCNHLESSCLELKYLYIKMFLYIKQKLFDSLIEMNQQQKISFSKESIYFEHFFQYVCLNDRPISVKSDNILHFLIECKGHVVTIFPLSCFHKEFSSLF